MKLTLYCFPYAGASAMVYARWRRKLPSWLDVQPVELPGRGRRILEPLQENIETLVGQLAEELLPSLDGPYALFGHSLGALLAFETAHVLRKRGVPEPCALFVSGTHAPSRRDGDRYGALQTDEELLAEMGRLNGTRPEVLDSPELLAIALPTLRADFRLCDSYRHSNPAPLRCPLRVFGGRQDETTAETLGAWRQESVGAFSLDVLEGDHFFLHAREDRLLELVQGYIEPAQTWAFPRHAVGCPTGASP